MKDYEDMQYFHTAERLVDAIVDPNDSRDFYRIVVNYYLSCVASMMRATVVTPHADSQQVMMYAIPLAPSGVGKGRSTSIMENQVLDLFKHNFMSYTMESSALSHFQIEAARRRAKIGIDRKAHKYRRAMPTACQNTSQLLRQRVILIHVEHLWIILSREVNNLRLSHFISTKGNPLIDLKVLEVIHASPHKSASPCACLSVSQHHNGRQMTAVADPHQIVRA